MPSQRVVMNRPIRFIDTLYCAQGALYQAIKVQLTAHPKMDLEFLKPYDLLVSLDSTDCSASICDLSTT